MEQHTAVLSVIAILEFAEMNFVNVSGSIDPTLLVWRGNSSHWISYETGTHLKSLSKQMHSNALVYGWIWHSSSSSPLRNVVILISMVS